MYEPLLIFRSKGNWTVLVGGWGGLFKVIVFDKPFINIAGGTKADLSNITVLITHPSKPNGPKWKKNDINNRQQNP